MISFHPLIMRLVHAGHLCVSIFDTVLTSNYRLLLQKTLAKGRCRLSE